MLLTALTLQTFSAARVDHVHSPVLCFFTELLYTHTHTLSPHSYMHSSHSLYLFLYLLLLIVCLQPDAIPAICATLQQGFSEYC